MNNVSCPRTANLEPLRPKASDDKVPKSLTKILSNYCYDSRLKSTNWKTAKDDAKFTGQLRI